MSERHFNRHNRRSGGNRPARILAPTLTPDERAIQAQRERIRAEFGAAGVARYDALLLAHAEADTPCPQDEPDEAPEAEDATCPADVSIDALDRKSGAFSDLSL